jgi:quinol monooxygenase YgiN
MPIRSRFDFMRRLLFPALALLLLAGSGLAWRATAQEKGTSERIYVVTHVDITPNNVAAGKKLLQQYAAESRKDKGAVRVELYMQISRPNHFTLLEVWENQQAYDAHVGEAHTKEFREKIQPMLGSPFDERPHQLIG